MKHYQTCTNPNNLTKLNLDATSYILQCDCCGAYTEVPTPPNPMPVTLDFSHLERRVMDHYGEEPPSPGDVYTGRRSSEVIETTTLGKPIRTYTLK